jgi:hypothetical protein
MKPLTSEALLEEVIEDALEAAVDYGYVQARRKYDSRDMRPEVEEKAEGMLDFTAEKLYRVMAMLRKGKK